MKGIDQALAEPLVRQALVEDVGNGDVTTLAVVPDSLRARAVMVARERLTVAGLQLVERVFAQLDGDVTARLMVSDGTTVQAGENLIEISGSARVILTGERTALNFVQRLSGIASLTRQFVDAVAGTRASILDTRKTTPGWRRLEKYAVSCGGGQNHREGLFDQVLIKDNHLLAIRGNTSRPISEAIRRARDSYPDLKVEVEVEDLSQFLEAVEAGAEIVLVDNMSIEEMTEVVERNQGRVKIEASGGIGLANAAAVAATGIDAISVGALTHSARAGDVALDFLPNGQTA